MCRFSKHLGDKGAEQLAERVVVEAATTVADKAGPAAAHVAVMARVDQDRVDQEQAERVVVVAEMDRVDQELAAVVAEMVREDQVVEEAELEQAAVAAEMALADLGADDPEPVAAEAEWVAVVLAAAEAEQVRAELELVARQPKQSPGKLTCSIPWASILHKEQTAKSSKFWT